MNMRLSVPSVLFGVLLVLAFIVRLYGFTNPVADWHSWRQADTSAVSRNFSNHGYDILHPRFDDLSNVPSGKDNPHGYRFVEFPLYNILQAGLYDTFGIFTLEQWGRLVTIFSSLSAMVFIYVLVKEYGNKKAAFYSAFLYAFLPYSVFYGRVILPDTSMIAAALGSVYFFSAWLQTKKKQIHYQFCISLLLAMLSLLLKPYAVFFLLPILYLSFVAFKGKLFTNYKLYLFALLSVLPLIGWRLWISQFPEGIPSNIWLLNGNGIRFRPSFFRWMMYERLIKLIMGYIGTLFVVVGLLSISTKKLWFFVSYMVGAVLYVTIFATGNVQHDYYQILILPVIVMVSGLGADQIVTFCTKKTGNKAIGYGVIAVMFIVSMYCSWQIVKGYYYINKPSIVTAGKAVDRLVEKDALVAALYMGDTSFLYQTNRKGWPTLQNGLDDLIVKGADYLVFADPTDEEINFGASYKIVEQKKEYIIFDLHTLR